MNLNKAIIVGRLTQDPENRNTASGTSISSFGIATNRIWTDQSGNKQENTEFHNIVVFGKLAEICSNYLNKGRLVLIEGRLQTRNWEDQNGNRRYRTEIIAENMQMGPRGGNFNERPSSGYSPPSSNRQENQNQTSEENIPVIEADEEPAPEGEKQTPKENTNQSGQEASNQVDVDKIPF